MYEEGNRQMKLLKFLMVFLLSLMLVGCEADDGLLNNGLLGSLTTNSSSGIDLNSIPKYNGEEFVAINNNVPNFDDKDKTTTSFETYSPLDNLGRCGEAYANIGRDLMPTQKRGDISSVKPSGWINKKYDTSLVDGGYIYNRCHLIGHQLAGEDANKENLITGTRYFNVDGMLPFENMIADYVKETNNHVLYRVTPIYDGNDLVAKGVQMEAYSVEDDGEGVMFNVFVYNVQPGIEIDYATGESWLSSEERPVQTTNKNNQNTNYNKYNSNKNNSSNKNDYSQSSNSYNQNKNSNGYNQNSNNYNQSNKDYSSNTGTNQTSGVIRGNSKSKIYHCPGQANYDDMSDSANLVEFASEQDAINALPVSAHQLILSKLLVAFILDIISSLVILLSIGIIAAFCLDMKDILLATSYFGQILKEIGAFYLFIPSTILSMIAGILFYYLCISIGNLFNTNKVLMGFVAFFAIQAILFFIGFFFGLGAALTGDATYTAINNSSYIISLVQSLILIAASYFGTYYIMTKRLNLD